MKYKKIRKEVKSTEQKAIRISLKKTQGQLLLEREKNVQIKIIIVIAPIRDTHPVIFAVFLIILILFVLGDCNIFLGEVLCLNRGEFSICSSSLYILTPHGTIHHNICIKYIFTLYY